MWGTSSAECQAFSINMKFGNSRENDGKYDNNDIDYRKDRDVKKNQILGKEYNYLELEQV